MDTHLVASLPQSAEHADVAAGRKRAVRGGSSTGTWHCAFNKEAQVGEPGGGQQGAPFTAAYGDPHAGFSAPFLDILCVVQEF